MRRTLLALVLCGVYAACSGAPRDDEAADRDLALDAAATTSIDPGDGPAPPRGSEPFAPGGCVRGGSTPAEVRAAMGEPDSIASGWWIYGRTQIQFGYGTVQDFIDGGNLVRCEPALP